MNRDDFEVMEKRAQELAKDRGPEYEMFARTLATELSRLAFPLMMFFSKINADQELKKRLLILVLGALIVTHSENTDEAIGIINSVKEDIIGIDHMLVKEGYDGKDKGTGIKR